MNSEIEILMQSLIQGPFERCEAHNGEEWEEKNAMWEVEIGPIGSLVGEKFNVCDDCLNDWDYLKPMYETRLKQEDLRDDDWKYQAHKEAL